MLRILARRSAALTRARGAWSPCRTLASSASGGISIPGTPRTLGDITKLELLEEEEPLRVGAIWEAFHQEKPHMAGEAVEPEEFERIATRGAESPMFVFPLRREGGHFMLVSQYSTAHSMFVMTFLEDYQRSPEMAQPWASVHLFDELITAKSVGLVRSEVMAERLTDAEAEHLLLLVRRFYGTSQYDKVWTFNHFNQRFDLDAYLASCP